MYGKTFVASALVLALSAIQSCPAPPIAIGVGIGVGAPLAGNLLYIGINDNVKRDADSDLYARADYPDRLPESAHNAYDQCVSQNGDGRQTTVTRLANNSFQITGVAPACMTLANFFTDDGAPYACGNDCLQYDNLSDEQVGQLMDTLGQLGKV